MMDYPAILSLVIWLPFVVAIGFLITPVKHAYVRYIALVVTVIDAILASLVAVLLENTTKILYSFLSEGSWLNTSGAVACFSLLDVYNL